MAPVPEKVAPRLVQFYPLLKVVVKLRGKQQKQVLRKLAKDGEFVSCLQEIATNIIENNMDIDKQSKRRLNKHSLVVRNLSKKKSINQSGGFLNIAVPLLATVVAELLK